MTGGLSLLESAQLLGHYRHAELTGFEKLARRAPRAASGEVRVYLLRAASSHAWRAHELEVLLPVSATLPSAASLTVALDDRVDEAFGLVAAASDDQAVAALRGVVYPALRASYLAHLARCTPVADGPVAVVLRRLAAELAAVIDEGEGIAIEGEYPLLASLEDLLAGGARIGGR